MKAYLDIVRQVLENGVERSNRTQMRALSLFGLQARYDLRQGFPLVTTKKVLFAAVLRELLWFCAAPPTSTTAWRPTLPSGIRGRTSKANWPDIRIPVAPVAALRAR